MTRIVVTGASGFVGRHVVNQLSRQARCLPVVGVVRRLPESSPGRNVAYVQVDDLAQNGALDGVLRHGDVVIHAAAHVHVRDPGTANSARAFRRVNVMGTERLARVAARSGARRFVFVSSIGVNGVQSPLGRAFTESDPPNPHNAYAESKCDAEALLWELQRETGLEIVVVRPPLVYGPGVRANFAALVRAVIRGWPLPLAAVHNRRSLIGVDNLANFLVLCASHPQAANQTFLASDGRDVATSELVRLIAKEAGAPARLYAMPPALLKWASILTGRFQDYLKLCGTLQVDISKARSLLGWEPPHPLEEGLRGAVTELTTRTVGLAN